MEHWVVSNTSQISAADTRMVAWAMLRSSSSTASIHTLRPFLYLLQVQSITPGNVPCQRPTSANR
jgi:hypothetical protein